MTTRGERLDAWLSARTGKPTGWQSDLVRRSGVKRQTITKWTRHDYDGYPELDSLAQVAKALGVTTSELVAVLDGDEPRYRKGDPELVAMVESVLDELLDARLDERGVPRRRPRGATPA